MKWPGGEAQSPRQVLQAAELWPADVAKPPRPKEAVEYLRKRYRINVQNTTFGKAAEQLSVRGCTDPSFLQLAEALRRWFPVEVESMTEGSL